jgi:hypothetical protein
MEHLVIIFQMIAIMSRNNFIRYHKSITQALRMIR